MNNYLIIIAALISLIAIGLAIQSYFVFRKEEQRRQQFAITVEDFDRAVSAPWSTQTCLLAQTAKRLDLYPRSAYPACHLAASSEEAWDLMWEFDTAHGNLGSDEKRAAVRAKLPIPLPVGVDGSRITV